MKIISALLVSALLLGVTESVTAEVPVAVRLKDSPSPKGEPTQHKQFLAPQGPDRLRQSKHDAAGLLTQKGAQPLLTSPSSLTATVLPPASELTGFDGIDENATFADPPDGAIAVGPAHVVEAVNTAISVWTKGYDQSGRLSAVTAAALAIDLNAFLGQNSGCLSSTNSFAGLVSDPSVDYDAARDRFMVSMISFDSLFRRSSLCVAVTQSGDPSASWYVYAFPISPAASLLDFPRAVIGSDGQLYVTGNLFRLDRQGTATFDSARVYAFKTADLYTGLNTTPQIATVGNDPQTGLPADSLTPARAVGVAGMYFVSAANPTSPSTGSAITLWKWSDPFGSNVFTRQGFVTVDDYTQPPMGVQQGSFPSGITDCEQTGAACFETNDTRNLTAYWSGGTVWAAHTMGCLQGGGPAACVGWYQLGNLDAAPSLLRKGIVDNQTNLGRHRYFPSLAVDQHGNVVLGYGYSSATEYPGVAYTTISSSGQLGGETVLKPGQATFQSTRYGDYASTALDPHDNLTIWHIQEYVKGETTWGTWLSGSELCRPEHGRWNAHWHCLGGASLQRPLGRLFQPSPRRHADGGRPVHTHGLGRHVLERELHVQRRWSPASRHGHGSRRRQHHAEYGRPCRAAGQLHRHRHGLRGSRLRPARRELHAWWDPDCPGPRELHDGQHEPDRAGPHGGHGHRVESRRAVGGHGASPGVSPNEQHELQPDRRRAAHRCRLDACSGRQHCHARHDRSRDAADQLHHHGQRLCEPGFWSARGELHSWHHGARPGPRHRHDGQHDAHRAVPDGGHRHRAESARPVGGHRTGAGVRADRHCDVHANRQRPADHHRHPGRPGRQQHHAAHGRSLGAADQLHHHGQRLRESGLRPARGELHTRHHRARPGPRHGDGGQHDAHRTVPDGGHGHRAESARPVAGRGAGPGLRPDGRPDVHIDRQRGAHDHRRAARQRERDHAQRHRSVRAADELHHHGYGLWGCRLRSARGELHARRRLDRAGARQRLDRQHDTHRALPDGRHGHRPESPRVVARRRGGPSLSADQREQLQPARKRQPHGQQHAGDPRRQHHHADHGGSGNAARQLHHHGQWLREPGLWAARGELRPRQHRARPGSGHGDDGRHDAHGAVPDGGHGHRAESPRAVGGSGAGPGLHPDGERDVHADRQRVPDDHRH